MRGERRKRASDLELSLNHESTSSNNKNGNFTTTTRRRFISLFTLMNTIEIKMEKFEAENISRNLRAEIFCIIAARGCSLGSSQMLPNGDQL